MAKKRESISAGTETTESDPLSLVSVPVPIKYIGPDYVRGINVPGTTVRIRPRDMSPEEIRALIVLYPPAAGWWSGL